MKFPSEWPEGLTLRLGKIAILFGQIEYLLKLYVKQFLEDFERGMTVTSRMQFNQLLELTTALAKQQIKSALLKKRFLELLPLLEKAQNKRNDYFHSAWGMSEEGNPVAIGYQRTRTTQQPNGTGLIKIRNVVNEPDLEEFIQLLSQIKEMLTDLRLLIWPGLRPRPPRKRRRTF
jgi:hypothetical protein